MIDFDFVSPTKIYFGKGKETLIGCIVAGYGFHRVLIVYGSPRIEKDLLPMVESKLAENGIGSFRFGGVRPNPLVSKAREGVEKARALGVDLILAIGGGSPIDTAKLIAAGFYYEGDPFDFNTKRAILKKALPVGVILTHASAGSELSTSAVLQDDETGVKSGFNSDLNRPLFAIENPELTYGVSPYQTAAGASDIMMHSLERYFDPSDEEQLADDWALALVKNTMWAVKRALKDPMDYQARAALMLNSSLSHNGLTGIGKTFGFVVHPMEHALSGYKPDIVHGAGVALVFNAWAAYVRTRDVAKFAKFARVLFNVDERDDEKASIIGVASMKEFFSSIGMPTTFAEVGLGEKDIPSLVSLVTGNNTRMIGCCHQSLGAEDVEAIFRSLL
ncbi:MAG: iron-containing alcohol dehydrogenase [Bacilli bacterium]|nr:iron-containing alcohol dehydrogenase [Bacilli bacterium]